jgi:solute carrier family 6 GABA transporter-like protein 1
MVSVLSAYIISWYYNVIISWAVVYLVASFKSPLPWSYFNEDFVAACNTTDTTRAEEFFFKDVVRYYDDDCVPYTDGAPVSFSVYAFFAVLFVWIVCFVAIFKGVKSSSYVVWVTVPLPVLFIIIMVIKGSTLEGASDGVSQYLKGDASKFDGLEGDALQEAKDLVAEVQKGVWGDAAGQIFFSIGVCMGIMTSYGSYNPVRKPIIMDNMIICISNSLLSFIAGFAVWSVVGYLQSIDSIAQGKTSSMGLAFIAYPTAIDLMSAPNLWAIMLSITLFTLGVDSAFSMVEATATVICDTKWGKQFPRAFVAFFLCLLGFLLSIPFCTNWGFFLFDVVDHYLSNYLLILVGIL